MTDVGQHGVYNRSELFPAGFIFSLAPRLTVDACAVNAYWSSHCRANTQHCRKRRQGFVQGKNTVCRGMDGVPRLSAEQDTSGTMPFVSRERYNFELFTQGFLSSVKRVIVD